MLNISRALLCLVALTLSDVEKMLAPYSDKVRELSTVIRTLADNLTKKGVGAGALGTSRNT
jgi:hypothetical protein